MKKALGTIAILICCSFVFGCGDDPLTRRRKMDDDMMAYKIRQGLVNSATNTTTVSVVSVATVTVTNTVVSH